MDELAIFTNALDFERPEERAAFLEQACRADAKLRARVEALLQSHQAAGNFLHECPLAGTSPTMDQHPLESPGKVIGPYKLLQQIGEGGMGVVYLAEQLEPIARRVALKVIKPGMDTRQVIARFEAERQALAMMDHANIARVLDAGATEQGRPYFVMELVHGVPITKYCDDNRVTPRQRLELFVPVCQAIQHAHQKGIIHRDIKPSNVMVTLYDGKPVPKVIDFGVAKATEQKSTEQTLFTQHGTMVGTLEYMSPEQAEMSALGVDTRSDIYSLGVLLYELLTGSTPLSRQQMREAAYGEILRLIKDVQPPKPSTRLSESGEALASISALRQTEPAKLSKLMRGELDWIVMKTLEKDRNRRYETANGVAADVQRYLSDEPVQACPPSASYRLRKFARRNRRMLSSAVVLSLAVLVVAGTLGWAVRDREARSQEAIRDRTERQAAIEREIGVALKEAEQFQGRQKWPEALSAARRAEGLLAGGSSNELRERVRLRREDLEMVLRIEEIPLLWSETKKDKWDYEGADRAYAQAFGDYGIDVARLSVGEATAGIRARPGVVLPLVVAMDDWATVRSQTDKAAGMELTAVAQAADTDVWRKQVREAVNSKDLKTLKSLAAGPRLSRQPAISLLVLARALRRHRLSEIGTDVLRQAQRQYPEDFWINFELGWELKNSGPAHREEAVSFFRAALAVRPRSNAVHNHLGILLDAQGKLTEAVDAYHKAIELAPGSGIAYTNLGNVLGQQDKVEEAVAAHRKAIEIDPQRPIAHYNLGNQLWRQDQLDDAIVSYHRSIELDPNYADAHCNLAIVLGIAGRWDEAIDAYREAIRINPKHALAHWNLSTALLDQKKLDEAVEFFRKAIAREPTFARTHFWLGRALQSQQKLNEAMESYRKAIELDPKFADAYTNLGIALYDQKRLDEAIASYRQAIEIDPLHDKAHNNLANALSAQGRFDEAVFYYRKSIELDPQRPIAHYNLAGVLNRQGKLDEAISHYRKAIELDLKGGDASSALGIALARRGWDLVGSTDPMQRDPKRAVELSIESVELTPDSAEAWQYLGWVQYRAGNWKDGIEALEKSCTLQMGGDGGQWIVTSLCHAKLATENEMPQEQRTRHQEEARRFYDQAVKSIDGWTLGTDPWAETIRGFRAEASALLEVKQSLE